MTFTVVQRLGKTGFLGKQLNGDKLLIVEGVDVETVADGDTVQTKCIMVFTRTHTYTSVSCAQVNCKMYVPLSEIVLWIREQDDISKKYRLPELTD